MKNKILLTTAIMFGFLFTAIAQPGGRPGPGKGPELRKQIEALRVGVYTRVLNLSTEEATKFWPVFNQFQGEMDLIQKDQKQTRKSLSPETVATLSDAELEKALDNMMASEQKSLDLKKKYIGEFKKVLPTRKVALMPFAQMEMKRELIERFKDFRDGDE